MTSIVSVSSTELKDRRQQLRRQRRIKGLQGLWRSLLIAGMAGGLVWLITLPGWVIRRAEQIEVKGNQLLATEAILNLLPLSYPQSLLQLKPQELSDELETRASIAEAKVTRQLFPPGVILEITEREPVAIAISPQGPSPDDLGQPLPMGYLDETGVWMPQSDYTRLNAQTQPKLKVIGINEKTLPYWPKLYQAISQSPVTIFEVDWQDRGNLILKTELGTVHFGNNPSFFEPKFKVLMQMQELPNQIQASDIDYIDLKNPELPSIQLKEKV